MSGGRAAVRPRGDSGGTASDRCPGTAEPAPPVGARRRLPHTLAAALDACLRPDPAARPTIAELTTALESALP
ncbi:hypothetical protein AB0950_23270 [Streptomyces sp. NPDC007189]|uniref:hypothetical protein n=1 Tax=Streptomyces sp. NPDC007189 TaxID=3154315 RepID=UPI0034545D85